MPPPGRPTPGPPSPQPITLFQSPPNSNGNDGAAPLAYDAAWQYFTNLTPFQVAWFQAQPEWQNFLAYVALDPPNATMHAQIGVAGVNAKLQAAAVQLATVATPITVQPSPSPVTLGGPAQSHL